MAQSGYTPIAIYSSSTATNVPLAADLVTGELAINVVDGKLYYKDSGGVVQIIASKTAAAGVTTFSGGTTGLTPSSPIGGAITLAGTLLQVNGGTGFSTYTTGDLLYASATNTLSKLGVGTNGYILSIVAGAPAWITAPPSGASISNDTSTATNVYPLFSNTTTGAPTTIYTSNTKYLYKPSTGDLQSSQLVASNGIISNSSTVATSYIISTGNNSMSVGPITVATGQSVTVPSGSRWVIL